MPSPLRIGIAGLGTVGAAVITLLGRQAEPLARPTGR
jgi:homoserine dehydrogenase